MASVELIEMALASVTWELNAAVVVMETYMEHGELKHATRSLLLLPGTCTCNCYREIDCSRAHRTSPDGEHAPHIRWESGVFLQLCAESQSSNGGPVQDPKEGIKMRCQ